MISIIDYGVGNLKSLLNGFKFLGFKAELVRTADEIVAAEKIVLPGVGAFGYAIDQIDQLGLRAPLLQKAEAATPILGICLGMQLLFTMSMEGNSQTKGLDLIKGRVLKVEGQLKVPHMGWNQIQCRQSSPLLQGVSDFMHGYFVHSYHCVPEDDNCVLATTDYGSSLLAMVGKKNIFGVQFHPEKSQELGLQILRNFGDFV